MTESEPRRTPAIRRGTVVALYALCVAAVAAVWIVVRMTTPDSQVSRWKDVLSSQTAALQQITGASSPSQYSISGANLDPVGLPFDVATTHVASRTIDLATSQAIPAEMISGTDADGYLHISFRKLASYEVDAKTTGSAIAQIPQDIRQLHGKKVAVRGFMIPLELTPNGKVRNFLLVKNQMLCCFGMAPGVADFIGIHGAKQFETDYVMDQPVTVKGTLYVGEVRKQGELIGLYLMDCDNVD